jgi:putative Holliday junction resolvase
MLTIAVDFGLKRSGIAVSDAENSFAMPLCTLPTAEVPEYLRKMHKEEGIGLVVLGFPLSLRGHENDMTRAVTAFQERLTALGFTVQVFDERSSTNRACTELFMVGVKGAKRKKLKDEVSAAVILEDFFQWRSRQ